MAQNSQCFQIEIGIVGGGIGGLSAAVALSKLGHRVTIFEAASKLSQIGAGIQMTPNASKHLITWGVCQNFINSSSRFPCFKVRRWSDGEIIGRMETEKHYEKFGGPYIQLHRADLQEGLVKVATENGVQLNVNSRVVDFDFDQPTIILEDGRSFNVDLIIAADGIKSVGRRQISGSEAPDTTSTGLAVFRATLDMDLVKQYPDLVHIADEPGISLWIGPSKHVVAYAMRGDSLVNLVLEYPESRPPSEWDESTYVDEVKAAFADWDPNLQLLLQHVKSGLKWPLRFSKSLEKWTSSSGRFVLLGDAAHVVPSFLAQGAAMAIEDAVTLASILSKVSSISDLPASLQTFERQRMERKEKVQELSLRNLKLYHLNDGESQRKRDGLDEFDNDGEHDQLCPIWRNEKDQQWLYGYTIN